MAINLTLPTKVRKNSLGPNYLSGLLVNLNYARSLMGVEHMASGEHNVRRVPRAVVSIIWSGSAYSISPTSADVTAVASPATGTITLTLATERFSTDIRPQINFKGTGVGSKPWISGYKVVSATSIQIFLQQLTSALGSGNAWAAADGSFDIALHSDPLNPGLWATTPINHYRGDPLTETVTDWNALIQGQGDMQLAIGAGHSKTTGVHAVREVAKAYAHVQWNNTAYVFSGAAGSHSTNVTGLSRTSAGICVVTYSAMTTPTQCFPCVDYGRLIGADPVLFIAQAEQTSATTSTVYIYKYDTASKTWALGDADFFLPVHGG